MGQLFSVFEHIHESPSLVVGIKLMHSIKLHILSKTHLPTNSYLACEHIRFAWNLWLGNENVGLKQISPWANVSHSYMPHPLHVSRSLISHYFSFQPLRCVSEHNISGMQASLASTTKILRYILLDNCGAISQFWNKYSWIPIERH